MITLLRIALLTVAVSSSTLLVAQSPPLDGREGRELSLDRFVPRSMLGGNGQTPPSEKVNIAVVGTGCHGIRHIEALLTNQPDIHVEAECDVNREGTDSFDLENGVAGREPARRLVEAPARHVAADV